MLELYKAAFPEREKPAMIDKAWKDLGFQSENPTTDLRSCGLLSLNNLVYMSDHYPQVFQVSVLSSFDVETRSRGNRLPVCRVNVQYHSHPADPSGHHTTVLLLSVLWHRVQEEEGAHPFHVHVCIASGRHRMAGCLQRTLLARRRFDAPQLSASRTHRSLVFDPGVQKGLRSHPCSAAEAAAETLSVRIRPFQGSKCLFELVAAGLFVVHTHFFFFPSH